MAATKTAFIGLGNMGYPMAGHLARTGHEVAVFNRTRGKADAWAAEYGGIAADTPAAAARGASLVFACVGNDDDLRAVALGDDGALAGMEEGGVFVDHTTASAMVERELAAIAEPRGISILDAPVSGGEEGAKNGVLTVMVGGDEAAFAKAEAAMASYGRAVTLMGPLGSGQLTKMVNQICCVGAVQGLAEGMNFAVRAGLDAKRVVDVISKGAAQSWQMDNRAVSMLEDRFDFGFAADWAHKDLGICLEEARANGAMLPVTALADQFYSRVHDRGDGRMDWSVLMRLLTNP
jgi:3-hydroxyisobutyrate dehydrogenase